MNTTTLRTLAASAALAAAGAAAPANGQSIPPTLDADLQSGLVLWLDATTNLYGSGGAPLADGGAVIEWYDARESESAIAAGSRSYNRARTYNANTEIAPTVLMTNGLPFVDFGDYGSGRWMIFDTAAGGSYPRQVVRSQFFVLGFRSTCNYPLGSVNGPTITGGETCFTRATLGASWGNISDGSYNSSVLPCGESRLNGRRVNPVQWQFERNAFQFFSQIGPGAVQRSYVNATWTGRIPWAKTLFNDRNYKPSSVSIARQGGGMVGEMLLFDRVVTDYERRRIEAYLAEKWFGEDVSAVLEPAGETGPLAMATGDEKIFRRPAARVYLSPSSGVAVTDTGAVSAYAGNEGGARLAATEVADTRRFEVAVTQRGGDLLLALDPAALGASSVVVKSGTLLLSPRAAAGAEDPLPISDAEATRAAYETDPGSLVTNGSFESPVRSGWGSQDPTGWTRSGNVCLCNGNATPWWTRDGLPLADGSQFIACQSHSTSDSNGSFAMQTFTAPFAGLYRAVVRVSQRHTGTTAPALVKLDGSEVWYHVVAYQTDARGTSDSWLEYEIDLPPLSAGDHSLSIGIAHEDSTDRTSLYDCVRVFPVAAGEFVTVPNPGFEAGPTLSTTHGTADANGCYPGRYQYKPTSTHTFWTFGGADGGNGGITQQDAPWWSISSYGKPGYELRDQRKGFVQLGNNATAAWAETIVSAPRAGRVRLSMRLSKRYNNGNLGHWLDVLVGGTAVGRAWPVSNTQEDFSCEFGIAAGTQALRLSAGRPDSMLSQDLSIVFDDIRIQYIDEAPFQDPARGAGDLSGWTTTGGAALVRDGTNSPNGVVSMPAGSSIEASFTLPEGGWHLLESLAAGAACDTFSSNGVYNSYLHYPARAAITVDGLPAGTIQAESDTFGRFALRLPYLAAGTHSIRLERETVNSATAAVLRLRAFGTRAIGVAAPADAPDAELAVSDGATLRLDYPGTIKVGRLIGPDGQSLVGTIDASSAFVSGPGSLEVLPKAFVIIMR